MSESWCCWSEWFPFGVHVFLFGHGSSQGICVSAGDYFIIIIFFLLSFFLLFVPRLSFLSFFSFPGGFGTWTLLLLLSCLLLSWWWLALIIVSNWRFVYATELRWAALIVTFQLLGFFFPAQLGPDLSQQELLFYCANSTRSVLSPWLPPTLTNHSGSVVVCCVLGRLWIWGCRGPLAGKQRKGKGALFILGCRAFLMSQHSELR